MPKIFNLANHNSILPKDCNESSPLQNSINEDKASLNCDVNNDSLFKEIGKRKKVGIDATTDPMQTGSIINDLTRPANKNVINRYSSALRGCDQGMTDLFKNLVVLDEDGKAHPVPIIWGTQEKAVAVILQNNVRKDNSLVVDKPILPMMAICSSDISPDMTRYIYHKAKINFKNAFGENELRKELREKDTIFGFARGIPINIGYTLYIWTLYVEDMNQILEQIILKFSPMAYIKVQNVPWEVCISLDSLSNNIDKEVADKATRIVKYQINFTAKTYIPQPIIRNKTVLKITNDFFNSVDIQEFDQVHFRDSIE